ncbi:MAG: MvaI/BcnI family restriction endonuclease [Betaproteobacteria bacterium]|nr:MvaI/BcnI family restriction endonuclease [Betaproteobacteria bacterium]
MVQNLKVDTLSNLIKMFADRGITRLYMKILAKNNNRKQQIYFGTSFSILSLFPTLGIFPSPNGDNPIFKAKINFWWMMGSGEICNAPGSQLIFYPQYPEVRFSGFLDSCNNGPSDLLDETTCMAGRLLFLGVHPDGRIIGALLPHTHPVRQEIDQATYLNKIRIFYEIPIEGDGRKELLERLKVIHEKGWIDSKRLDSLGNILPCTASQCGGYTLEAEFGISPNGDAAPDFKGWELKQYSVDNFKRVNSSVITLMTPEPTGGYYKTHGVELFIRKFGYPDKMGRVDRLNFGGVHKVGEKHTTTGLTLTLVGFDATDGKILTKSASLSLLTDTGEEAATWTYVDLMNHWNHKHAQTAYIPSLKHIDPRLQYRYGNTVRLGEGVDFLLVLKAMFQGKIYYDPGIKLENASSAKPTTKRRNQFRVKSGDLSSLYLKMEPVDVSEI